MRIVKCYWVALLIVLFAERDLDAAIPLYYFGSVQAYQSGGVQFVKECKGGEDLVQTYYNTIRSQTLSGPTSFIPLINEVSSIA